MYCFFEAGEKTVTNSYDVIADTIRPDDDDITFGNATVPTSIVNATAPSPSVSFFRLLRSLEDRKPLQPWFLVLFIFFS